MHDWWLSLVASALGSRQYLDQSLIDYRQHASNAIGAKAQDKPVAFKTIVHRLFDDRHGEIFRLNARQARGFLARFGGELTTGGWPTSSCRTWPERPRWMNWWSRKTSRTRPCTRQPA